MPSQQLETAARDSLDWKKIIYESLIELGVGRKELDLYTASTDLGPSTIAQLAEHLGLSKPSVYKSIEQLSALGLANAPSRSGRYSTFMVEPATEILKLLERKKERCEYLKGALTTVVPDIVASRNRFMTQANIQMYRGRVQLNVLHDSVLNDPDGNLRFFGSPMPFRGMFTDDEYEAWTLKKIRAGIWNKVLIPTSEKRILTPSPETALREIRVFKGESAFSTTFQLFSNKVIFWWPETEAALLINDPDLFKMMDAIFTTYWNSATPARELFDTDGNSMQGRDNDGSKVR